MNKIKICTPKIGLINNIGTPPNYPKNTHLQLQTQAQTYIYIININQQCTQ